MDDITQYGHTSTLLKDYAALQRRIVQEMSEYEANRQAILAPVAEALAELECTHKDFIEPLQAEAACLVEQIKAAALAYGRSVKAHGLHAVVTSGRVSWDDKFLMGYAAAHEEILQARREGQPSVSLREVK